MKAARDTVLIDRAATSISATSTLVALSGWLKLIAANQREGQRRDDIRNLKGVKINISMTVISERHCVTRRRGL